MHTEKSFAPPFYGNQNVVTGYSIPDFDPGYFIQPEVLTAAECDALLEHFAGMPRGRAGTRHLMRHPEVAALANSECLLALARRALGNHATPFRATLFNKSAAANWLVAWHQDTALPLTSRFEEPGWGPWSEKEGILYAHAPAVALSRIVALRIHLDASTSDNGPLRVIPGSHTAGLMTDEQVLAYAWAHQETECTVPRGGVLAMRPLLIHCSSKARTTDPRRVLHIEYADSLEPAPGIKFAVC